MKRFSLIVLLFIGFSFSCLAQPEHRIAFSVGFYNHSFLCAEYAGKPKARRAADEDDE